MTYDMIESQMRGVQNSLAYDIDVLKSSKTQAAAELLNYYKTQKDNLQFQMDTITELFEKIKNLVNEQ